VWGRIPRISKQQNENRRENIKKKDINHSAIKQNTDQSWQAELKGSVRKGHVQMVR